MTTPRSDEAWVHPVLLGLLMSGPRHGYELYQELEQDLGEVWHIGLSRLYAQLKQLQEAGLVTAQTQPQPNRPSRKVYETTDEGREVFLHWLYQPAPNLRRMRVEFMLRLYLFGRLSLPGAEHLVAAQRALCAKQAGRFGQAAAEAGAAFPRLVYEFRRGQMQAAIHWLERCLELQAGEQPGSPQGLPSGSAPQGQGTARHTQGGPT